MVQRYYFIEGLFILLGLALIVAIIKYPKDALIKLPLGIVRRILSPLRHIWNGITLILSLIAIPFVYLREKYKWRITPTLSKVFDLGRDKEDRPYPSKRNLTVDFSEGDKFIFVSSADRDLRGFIGDFLDTLTGQYNLNDFKVTGGEQKLVRFPSEINFYDFHLLVQHFDNELGEKKSFGVFKSGKLQYYVYQDENTLNNLVGFTSDKKYFSINMYDDLESKQYLRLNPELELETKWVERWNGTTANKVYEA